MTCLLVPIFSSQLTRIKIMAIQTAVLLLTQSMVTPRPWFCKVLRGLILVLVSLDRCVVLTDHLARLENLTKKGWLQTGSRKSCLVTQVLCAELTAKTCVLVSTLLNLGSLVIISCFQRVAHIVRYQILDWHFLGEYYPTFLNLLRLS